MSLTEHLKPAHTEPQPQPDDARGAPSPMFTDSVYRRAVVVTLPGGSDFPCTMRLVPLGMKRAFEVATHAAMSAKGLSLSAATAEIYEHDAILRKLAYAVCEPDSDISVGTYETWRDLAPEPLVGQLWRAYTDAEHALDPHGAAPPDPDSIEALVSAIKTKDRRDAMAMLTACGSRVLAACLIATCGHPSIAPETGVRDADTSTRADGAE